MPRRRTTVAVSAAAAMLALSAAVPASSLEPAASSLEPAARATSTDPAPAPETAADQPGPAPVEADPLQHSSDTTEPVFRAAAATATTAPSGFFDLAARTRPVAPGLRHTGFDRLDERGWVRVNALTAKLATPGLRLDYAAPGRISAPAPLVTAVRRDGAVAAVNGDFFDIGDTGAPLGVGVDRQRGVLHGSRAGANNTFTLDRYDAARVLRTYLEASVTRRGRRPITVTNLNAPVISPGGIGIYTAAWGSDARTRVLPSSAARREVVVRGGRVRANRTALSSGPIPADSLHLVGVGEGAKRLRSLPRGARVSVSYALSRAARVAIGGNVVLLRDGKVLAPGDLEMHPRTAIGIDRDTNSLIIVAVDGRQEHSRGLTMKETATLLKTMGAEDGLNLDGGGSSTMMARESGEGVAVVNSPSDGRLRSVPNGLGFMFAAGSGRLRGLRIEALEDDVESYRVLQGLSRVLVARGHDETYDPVPASPSWQGSPLVAVRPGPAQRTIVTGRGAGTGTVTASAGSATGQLDVQVLGPVGRLEASVPSISLAGKGRSAAFAVRGYDARGFHTWVEPRDVRLAFNRDVIGVRRTPRGFVVFARVPSASNVIRVSAGGRRTYVGVAVGLARSVVNPMNTVSAWRATAYPAAASASLSLTRNRAGRSRSALAMRYALYGKSATRSAYLTAVPVQKLPRRARRVGVWVRGDANGAWLRITARDAAGSRATLTLAQRVTWRGWRFLSVPLPSGLAQPLKVVRLYAVETRRARKYAGVLAFDDLTVFTDRTIEVPSAPLPRDPMVAHLAPAESSGLRVAVMSDAGIAASMPTAAAAIRARRTMREILAARPNLVLINGDLVAKGSPANIRFAKRLITEELGGRVAWRYLPGERELNGAGTLDPFRSEFGDPVRVFTQAGTQFVLLNSAKSTFRLSGFHQLVRLQSALDSAVSDATIHSVVVVAHHPTSDTAPGGTAEVADPREGALVEGLLADFAARSHKGVAYVGSHGRRFELSRTDGVPRVLSGPVTGPARTSYGSFTGWSMLRIDPGAEQWLSSRFVPHVDALRVNVPDSLAVGAVTHASATVTQAGRRMLLAYPMNGQWPGSETVHIGPRSTAPASAVIAFAPDTGTVTALRAGAADLAVTVNGTTARRRVVVR